MHEDAKPDEAMLRNDLHLTRMLFERDGDAFLEAVTKLVLDGHLAVSEDAVLQLLTAVKVQDPNI